MIRASVLLLLVGCNDLVQLAPDPLGNLVQLEVTPKTGELLITDLSSPPDQLAFRAIGVFSDGARRDVTQQLVWNVDNPLPGSFLDPGVYTTSNLAAGHVEVIALADEVWATSDITVRIDATLVDTAFPPSDPNLFDDAKPVMVDPVRSPALVYPNTGTVFPQGLPNTVFQFTPGDLNDAFRITFDTELMHLVVLTGADRWESGGLQQVLSQSNLGDLVTVSIEAAAAADPGTIYQGSSISLKFSGDAPDGPLYFWSAATDGIMRGAIGTSFAGKLYPDDSTCVGCHTISRDGSKMAMGYGAEAVSALQSIEVQTLATDISQATLYDMGWATYSPDGSLLLVANAGQLFLRDGITGTPINTPTGKVALPLGHFATHPDWSPDGKYVAVAYTSQAPTNLDVKSASIARLAFDAMTNTFSGPEILVPSTAVDNFYFPKYSPDGAYLAFTHATEAAHGALSAELGLVAHDGGLTTSLATASHRVASVDGIATATQMPTWAPFTGDYAWLGFASARPYGVVLPSGGRSQIWITAIDLANAQPEVDTSAASFWLPCQDVTVTNNNPIWAPSETTPQ
jgi:TolB protein